MNLTGQHQRYVLLITEANLDYSEMAALHNP